MDSAELSKRTHFWLRVAAIAAIAAAAWVPRSSSVAKGTVAVERPTIQASVSGR